MPVPNVSINDLDELADTGRWPELLALAAAAEVPMRDRLDAAHVVAREAPATLAAAATELFPDDDQGPWGALWEVVARRPWRELAPHLTTPRVRAMVAQTRVLFGEDLRGEASLQAPPPEAPLWLEPWEAAYWHGGFHMTDYDRNGSAGCVTWAFPHRLADLEDRPAATAPETAHPAVPVLTRSFELATGAAFHGTAWEAAATVAPGRPAGEFRFAHVYPHLVHLGAGDDGWHGRTGQAVGRLAVWRSLTAMAGPALGPAPAAATALAERLRCVGWREPGDGAWFVHVAMEDPAQGVAWVITGHLPD